MSSENVEETTPGATGGEDGAEEKEREQREEVTTEAEGEKNGALSSKEETVDGGEGGERVEKTPAEDGEAVKTEESQEESAEDTAAEVGGAEVVTEAESGTEKPTEEGEEAVESETLGKTEDGEEIVGTCEETEATGEMAEGVVNNDEDATPNEEGVAMKEEENEEKMVNEEEGVVKEEEGVVSSVVETSESHMVSVSRTQLENIAEEEAEEEEEEEEEVDRDELLTNCGEALRRQERLRHENAQLQHKIADYLSHKKEEKPDPGRNVTDQEKRYLQCMSALEQLEVELGHARAQWISREQEVREMCTRRQGNVQEKTEEFLRYQQEGTRQAVDSRTGHRLSDSELKKLQSAQLSSDQAVFQARLESIKLANKIERMESLLKEKEELAEGLHMLDFEQLKISNMDIGEKVEERNEDIGKLTDKIRDTVQVLTHVKEKLNFLQEESEEKKEQLRQLDSDLARRREVLTRLKQTRDSLRLDNQRLRQRGGLVCHTQLLRDFEERQDQNTELEDRLERLQRQHSQTTVQCAGLRRKIADTNSHLLH